MQVRGPGQTVTKNPSCLFATIPSCPCATCPGVPKNLALPIRVYQATFPPGCLHCSRGPEAPLQSSYHAAWCCTPTRTYQATPPHDAKIKLLFRLGPWPQNLLHFHACQAVKLPSRFCTSIKLGFRLLQIKLSGEATRFRCGCAKVAKSLPSLFQVFAKLVARLLKRSSYSAARFRNRKIPLTRNFIF